MQGYYKCKKCNILIDVVTTSRSALAKSIKVKINKCPSCDGKIQEIEIEDFENSSQRVFLRLRKKNNFKHIGDRLIHMKVKFL